jgi:hypothetical protein
VKEDVTMKRKWLTAGLAAVVGVLAWAGPSRAGDIIRLNGVDNAPTNNLLDDGRGADTIRTWYRGWGGYRGFGWGGYRGFGYGGFYRPYVVGYGGFYRPYYGLGFYRPYYGFGLGYGIGFGLGYGGFYPGYGVGYGGFFGPCAGATANVYTLNIPMATLGTPLPGAAQPRATDLAPVQPPANGTFPYDGGPQNPVPNPKQTSRPSTTPQQRDVPLEGRSVSLPKAAPKWTYPAYGETARRTTPAADRTYLTRGDSKKPASR